MLGYVTLGTNDRDKAAAFYDELMGSIGFGRIFEDEKLIIWGKNMDEGAVGVTTPFNDEPATIGNGVMVAMQMKTTDEVDAFYNKALSLGATDEGPPGKRIEGFYAGYFRDLDGNKLNAFVLG